MTEAELFTSFHAAVGTANSILFAYMSLISGFLLMSYLVADKLSTYLASIVVPLFCLAAGLLIFRLQLNRNDAREIMTYMLEQKQSGALDLPWLGVNPAWTGDATAFLELAVTIGGLLGCIVFFFFQWRSRS